MSYVSVQSPPVLLVPLSVLALVPLSVLALVPLSPAARRLLARDPVLMRTVVTGGDDYEILATVSQPAARRFAAAARKAGVPVARIGTIVEAGGAPRVLDAAGVPIPVDGGGHTHF